MAKIGLWIASEENENLRSEDIYFWLWSLIYFPAKTEDEFFVFGLANRCGNFKSYLDETKENTNGVNFCIVPDNSKFELEVKKLHWRIFKVFEIVRDAYIYFRSLSGLSFKNAFYWFIAPFALIFLFVLKGAIEYLISFFNNLSLRSWPRRLVTVLNRSEIDYLIVPDLYLAEWSGVNCPVKLWDRRSWVSLDTLKDSRVGKSLLKYSSIMVASKQVSETLKKVSLQPNLVEIVPVSRMAQPGLKAKKTVAVIQSSLIQEYQRNGNFYYPDLDLINIPYLVCTTKDCGLDDIKTLIRAFEDLVRNKRINCKLVFTAELEESSRNLVAQLGLLFDVLWIKEMNPLAVEAVIQSSKCLVITSRSFEDGLASWFKASFYQVPTCVADSESLQKMKNLESLGNIIFDVESIQSISNSLKYAMLYSESVCLAQTQFINTNYDDEWEKSRLQILRPIN